MPGNSLAIIPPQLQYDSTTVTPKLGSSSNEWRAMATVGQIERKMQTSRVLNCRRDYEYWALQYAQELARQSIEA